eukprot:6192311-Pleurochrysis_carterae.AAC.1
MDTQMHKHALASAQSRSMHEPSAHKATHTMAAHAKSQRRSRDSAQSCAHSVRTRGRAHVHVDARTYTWTRVRTRGRAH